MQVHQDHRGICVIGSLNVDQSITLPRFHQPGETITGTDMHTYAGGKGGNQAVAAARLGADVRFIGMLGDDANGSLYRRVLRKEHVDCSGIRILKGIPTGLALIEVDAQGENPIVVVPGANAMLEAGYVCAMLQHMPENALYMMQLEVPLETVKRAARCIRETGGTLLLDPAPAIELEDGLLKLVDILTPNEHELKVLTGMDTGGIDQAEQAARSLLARGVGAVVAKLGNKGSLYVDAHTSLRAPGYAVQAVDTTAAGDTFNAGLAVALSRGLDMAQALQVANAAGALAVTYAGAQAGMPSWAQVQQLIKEQPA